MANVVVVGAQWGDEGKGKIVDWLSVSADVIVRFQGGHNAGHTLVIDGKVFKLALLPSGFSPPLPADLLASEQMKQLVARLREDYEYVIFDTPPLLSVSDPLVVAAQSDGVVLVVRQGYCTRAMLMRAREILHEVDLKIYGFVLNGVNASLPEYYGYMGYYAYDYKE